MTEVVSPIVYKRVEVLCYKNSKEIFYDKYSNKLIVINRESNKVIVISKDGKKINYKRNALWVLFKYDDI